MTNGQHFSRIFYRSVKGDGHFGAGREDAVLSHIRVKYGRLEERRVKGGRMKGGKVVGWRVEG